MSTSQNDKKMLHGQHVLWPLSPSWPPHGHLWYEADCWRESNLLVQIRQAHCSYQHNCTQHHGRRHKCVLEYYPGQRVHPGTLSFAPRVQIAGKYSNALHLRIIRDLVRSKLLCWTRNQTGLACVLRTSLGTTTRKRYSGVLCSG